MCIRDRTGAANTSAIINYYNGLGLTGVYAAEQCSNYNVNGFTGWYVPALCQWTNYAYATTPCTISNIIQYLVPTVFNPSQGVQYWTSTTRAPVNNIVNIWAIEPQSNSAVALYDYEKGGLTRCARDLTQPS